MTVTERFNTFISFALLVGVSDEISVSISMHRLFVLFRVNESTGGFRKLSQLDSGRFFWIPFNR
jgi:hypothetical protein